MVRISIWTAIVLVLLRLAIGWHFLFEGVHKIHVTNIGLTESNRPFSSEAFFREAEGPAASRMREFLGDPDAAALAKLAVREPDKDADPSQVKLHELMPPALDAEWNAYFQRFVEHFKIAEKTLDRADAILKQSKDEVVRWLREGKKEVKKKSPASVAGDADVTVTTPQRIAEYQLKLATIRDVFSRELPAFGQDVEKSRLRALKSEAATMRNDLLKDLDGYTTKMKDALAVLLVDRTSGFNPALWDAIDIDEALVRMLTPKEADLAVGQEERGMPPDLGLQWDEYVAFAKQFGAMTDAKQQAEADEKETRAKRRFVRWLSGKDEYSGEPNPQSDVVKRVEAYRTAAEKYRKLHRQWLDQSWFFIYPRSKELEAATRDVTRLRASFQTEIQRHTDTMKNQVGSLLSPEQVKGYPPEQKKDTRQQQLDRVTMWGLTVIGGMLLVGLFTRVGCLLAAGFLIMTYLNHPALPYLPTSPMNEGHYLYVNKNIIEMLALLALATTRSGQWLGIDALISRFCCRRREA